MKKIKFTKMVASGNDFIVTDFRLQASGYRVLGRRICDRKYGVGADGLLVLERSGPAQMQMRIFNADGSEAQMCGNGARCAAQWVRLTSKVKTLKLKIKTKAGLILAQASGESIKIRLTDPKDMREDLPITLFGRLLHANFINTGVPHAIVFVEGLERIDVAHIGRAIRTHKAFLPKGTNADFVEVLNAPHSISVRTFERGVEDETLACGTGVAASALLYALRYAPHARQVQVLTRSGESCKVYFDRTGRKFMNVWLEGKARVICQGEYYV